jgi:hypothetical protein
MSFFDPPPPEPSPPAVVRYRQPDWSGPAENFVAGVAALELVLVNTGRTAVWIAAVEAYPNGAILNVVLRGRGSARPNVQSEAKGWRFGVQFSDGRKATVYGLGAFALARRGGPGSWRSTTALAHTRGGGPPDGPLLIARGGGGGFNSWRQEYWLWPLPPSGDLVIACEWPEIDLPLTTATVSAELLRDAAGRAQELWPVEDLPEPPL